MTWVPAESPTMSLQSWATANAPDEGLIYKSGFWNQVIWVRDDLSYLVSCGLKKPIEAQVISSHRSKSVRLPVYELTRPDLGLRLILRDNYSNWKLSCITERPLVVDFSGLFRTTPPIEPDYTGDPLHSVYFEGFPKNLVFGYYEPSDKLSWSAEINGGNQVVWAAVFLIMKSLGAVKPLTWHTRESHRAELDEERARWAAERAEKQESSS